MTQVEDETGPARWSSPSQCTRQMKDRQGVCGGGGESSRGSSDAPHMVRPTRTKTYAGEGSERKVGGGGFSSLFLGQRRIRCIPPPLSLSLSHEQM